jgi:hypothetical protein
LPDDGSPVNQIAKALVRLNLPPRKR